MAMYPHLFTPFQVGPLTLKNRLTMAPLYLGYADLGGAVSPVLLEHYRLMAASGVAMVVVENAAVDFENGSGSPRTLRADTDAHLDGLKRLAAAIKEAGALACLQINHAGRFAHVPQPVAPSAVDTFGRLARALTVDEMKRIVERFAAAAGRVEKAGFDMVELHGGTGYLLAEFLSPRTNRRDDAYGGSLENRRRFPLEVLAAVKETVNRIPVGYRFLVDESLDDGLKPEEATRFARDLEAAGIAYISAMGGTYESFGRPEIIERSRRPGYMLALSAAVKAQVEVPVIAAGRLSTGKVCEKAIAEQKTDLIGLGRVLWADPDWPRKVADGREDEIIHCNPDCGDACMQMVMKGRPALCVSWPPEKMKTWKTKFA